MTTVVVTLISVVE